LDVLNVFAVGANLKFQFILAAVSKIHTKTVATTWTLTVSVLRKFKLFEKAFSIFVLEIL